MWWFNRKPAPSIVPDEDTQDRARMKEEALRSLRRAKALKKRSAAMAADLNEHGETNHYIERIREAYGMPR